MVASVLILAASCLTLAAQDRHGLQQLQSALFQEKELKKKRLRELDQIVKDLERRQGQLALRIQSEESALRNSLRSLHGSQGEDSSRVRAQALARVASAQQKRLEGLRADQTDHEEVQLRIHRERAELDSIVQDLRENDSLSQFYGEVEKNLKSKIAPKLAAQMEKLKQLRARRAEVDDLMKGLVARAELQKIQDAEAKARGSMVLGEFARQRGLLALPVAGTVVSEWGRVKDPETGLFIFKKGIEIQSTEPIPSEVRSVAAGRVVFAGPLGDYGRALVLDHGENHYTLTGQLGKTLPAIGTFVRAGELVGYSFPKKSLYFEIRAGRVPVNPLQWIKR